MFCFFLFPCSSSLFSSFVGSTKTPQWRKGPSGKKDLCNACGIRYRKLLRSDAMAQQQPPPQKTLSDDWPSPASSSSSTSTPTSSSSSTATPSSPATRKQSAEQQPASRPSNPRAGKGGLRNEASATSTRRTKQPLEQHEVLAPAAQRRRRTYFQRNRKRGRTPSFGTEAHTEQQIKEEGEGEENEAQQQRQRPRKTKPTHKSLSSPEQTTDDDADSSFPRHSSSSPHRRPPTATNKSAIDFLLNEK
ncbi:GATA-type domain-containing protein, variant 2 [Balamuthia mandrillaris]